jgi:predicted DCC family thiol-disulfide oxidoreductase YuxK
MSNNLTIEISGLPDETARVILCIAAQRDISPNQVAIELLNHVASKAEWKPALPALPAPNDYPN